MKLLLDFQQILLCISLLGLSFLLPLLILSLCRDELKSQYYAFRKWWKSLSVIWKAILPIFLFSLFVYGSTKPPKRQTMNVAKGSSAYEPHFLEMESWHRRGAWAFSDHLVEFKNGFLFPCGTNHLSSVAVVSQGRMKNGYFDKTPFAELGCRLAMLPGRSRFNYEYLPSVDPRRESYIFRWTDCLVERDGENVMDASIQLLRSGDYIVVTNGVERFVHRELPFPHNGFGQDDEWITANFTNATEILSTGYHDWVDAQVGTGLENGLYKLIVTVPETPPETTQLCVGDYSVAVTNTGNYVFLLEKGVKYPLSVFPCDFTNITYSAVDDISRSRMTREAASEQSNFVWTIGVGGFLFEPSSLGALGWCMWVPNLRGSPDVGHLGPGDFQKVFTAVITDCRYAMDALYEWSSSSVDVDIVTPDTQSTLVRIKTMPSWREANLNVTATLCGTQLVSTLSGFSYGTNETPQVWLSADFPKGVALGGKRQLAKISFDCDVETNGTLTVRCVNGSGKISLWSDVSNGGGLGFSHTFDVSCEDSFSFFVQGEALSGYEEVEFECSFIPESGTSKIIREKMTVFACYTQPIENNTWVGYQVVNPSFLSSQSNAAFRVEVQPIDIPDSKINWRTVAGTALFPLGTNGVQTVVRGVNGDVDLEVNVLGVSEETMHLRSKVIQHEGD